MLNKKQIKTQENIPQILELAFWVEKGPHLKLIRFFPRSFRINLRKFCPTVVGCYYWNDIPLSIREKQLKNCLKEHFSTTILLSINHRHTDSQMLHFFMCVCVYVLFFFPFF